MIILNCVHLLLNVIEVCTLLLFVMHVAFCTHWRDLIFGSCLHHCLSCYCAVSLHAVMLLWIWLIRHPHTDVSCLTFGLRLNSLSLTTQQQRCASWTALIICHHAPVTLSQIQDELGGPRFTLWPRSCEQARDILKDVPLPHSVVFNQCRLGWGGLCRMEK